MAPWPRQYIKVSPLNLNRQVKRTNTPRQNPPLHRRMMWEWAKTRDPRAPSAERNSTQWGPSIAISTIFIPPPKSAPTLTVTLCVLGSANSKVIWIDTTREFFPLNDMPWNLERGGGRPPKTSYSPSADASFHVRVHVQLFPPLSSPHPGGRFRFSRRLVRRCARALEGGLGIAMRAHKMSGYLLAMASCSCVRFRF
jgi:hypothetical protein